MCQGLDDDNEDDNIVVDDEMVCKSYVIVGKLPPFVLTGGIGCDIDRVGRQFD